MTKRRRTTTNGIPSNPIKIKLPKIDKIVKKGGRPRVKIDWDKFDKLCVIQCTCEEIANWFECSVDTIERRCKEDKDLGFAEYFKKKSVGGKISLRRAQFKLANEGNTAMLIFLGKQYLGQTDGPPKGKGELPSFNDVDWGQIGKSFASAAEKIATKVPVGFANGD